MTPAPTWSRPGSTVTYVSPETGQTHTGIVAYGHKDGRRLYVRFHPPIPGTMTPTPVPVACCRPSAEAP